MSKNNYKNELGNKYGKLTVIDFCEERIRNRVCWKCQCDCGKIITVIGTDLRTGRKTHCGCSNPNMINEIGNHYGHLTVIAKDMKSANDHHVRWLCQCDCGKIVSVSSNNLRNYEVQSCGCSKRSFGEEEIERILRNNNIDFIEEYFDLSALELIGENNRCLRFDFAILDSQKNVIRLIEFDGKQHFLSIKKWGGEEALQKRQAYDKIKNNYALRKNIPLVRLPYSLKGKITLKDILGDKYLIGG